MIAVQIARLIANYSMFLDHTGEELLDPDTAVKMMEVLGHDLQALDKGFLRELVDAFAVVAEEQIDPDARESVRTIPHGYYLEEAIAENDPVRLTELEALRDAEDS